MVQIVELSHVPCEALTMGRDKPQDAAHMEAIIQSTVECFALCRDSGNVICVGGLRHLNFMDQRPLMWCSWLEDTKPTVSELRDGRELLTEWFESRGDEFYADISETDTVAQRFAEWLGFKFLRDWAGFKLYVRVV